MLDVNPASCAFWVCLCLASGSVNAQSQKPAAQAARGKVVAQAQCEGCHGTDGQAPSPDFPKLAGQLPGFLALQLRNYKSGERPHVAMGAVAKQLAPGQIQDVSVYYASLPAMRGRATVAAASSGMWAQGELVFMKGKPGAPACQYCHGVRGQGVAPIFPRLAGQHAKFIVASIQPYRALDDFKNPYAFVMKAVVQNLSDADIEAVAVYVEAMK